MEVIQPSTNPLLLWAQEWFFIYTCLGCHTRTSWRPIKNLSWKKNKYLVSCSLRGTVLFKESSPNVMVIRNPNWSIKILWHGTGYAKGKILSPLKSPTWGRLHCRFCLKLLRICFPLLFFFTMFLILASMNIHLRIFPTMLLVNIA
jgi:hypothetical protein